MSAALHRLTTVGTMADPSTPTGRGTAAGLAGPLVLYTVVRLVMTLAIAGLIMVFEVPFIVALAFAVVIQMPLSWLLLGKLRAQVNQGLAEATARRRAERERLQAALAGDQSDDPTDR